MIFLIWGHEYKELGYKHVMILNLIIIWNTKKSGNFCFTFLVSLVPNTIPSSISLIESKTFVIINKDPKLRIKHIAHSILYRRALSITKRGTKQKSQKVQSPIKYPTEFIKLVLKFKINFLDWPGYTYK